MISSIRPVLEGLFGGHVVVALHVLFDGLDGLAGVLGQQFIHLALDAHDLLGLNGDVRRLTARAAQRLVDHDLGVGQGLALALRARGEQKRAHRGGHAHAHGGNFALDVVHGIVDGHARGDGAARAVDVEHDVLIRVLHLQKEHLVDDEVGRIVVDLAAQEHDAVLQKPGKDVVGTLPAVGLFNNIRYQVHGRTSQCVVFSV